MGNRLSAADTTLQAVAAMLKATGSTDADVLFAAKTEYARPFSYQRACGLVAMAVALVALASLSLVPAMVGLPIGLAGFRWWRKGARNLAIVDAAYDQFVSGLARPHGADRNAVVRGP